MNTYDLINPSDKYTFHAANDRVAVMATLLVGQGAYAAQDENGKNVGGMLMFMEKQAALDSIKGWLGCDMRTYLDAHRIEVAEALESFAPMSKEERTAYDKALKYLTPEQAAEYRENVKETLRTSLNDIGTAAHEHAKLLRSLEVEA